MALVAFLISILFLWLVARRKGIGLLSAYGIFAAFQMLYNLAPASAKALGADTLTLLLDSAAVNTQLLLAASANVCFGIVHAVYYRKPLLKYDSGSSQERQKRNYVLWSVLPFLLGYIMVMKYGWNALTVINPGVKEAAGGMFVLTAYIKNCLVALYVYYLYRFGVDKWAWVLLGAHTVLVVLDGARTTFLPIAFLTLLLFDHQGASKLQKRKLYALALCGLSISIAARSLSLEGGSLLARIGAPVTSEGLFGAYPSLQAIHVLSQDSHPRLTYGASYILDPIIWIVPQGDTRSGNLIFHSWATEAASSLQEDFGPMGGFYYVAEAVAAFSYAGPAIITTLFASVLIWVERNVQKHRLLFVTWMPTFGILFAKMVFGNLFKLFLVQLMFVSVFVVVRKYRISVGKWLTKERLTTSPGILTATRSSAPVSHNEWPVAAKALPRP